MSNFNCSKLTRTETVRGICGVGSGTQISAWTSVATDTVTLRHACTRVATRTHTHTVPLYPPYCCREFFRRCSRILARRSVMDKVYRQGCVQKTITNTTRRERDQDASSWSHDSEENGCGADIRYACVKLLL